MCRPSRWQAGNDTFLSKAAAEQETHKLNTIIHTVMKCSLNCCQVLFKYRFSIDFPSIDASDIYYCLSYKYQLVFHKKFHTEFTQNSLFSADHVFMII